MQQRTQIEFNDGKLANVSAKNVTISVGVGSINLTAVELETIHAAMLDCQAVEDLTGVPQ